MLCRRKYFFILQILEWCRHPLQCSGMDFEARNRPHSHFIFKALQHDLLSYFSIITEKMEERSIFIQPSLRFSENEHDLIHNYLQHANIQLYFERCISVLLKFSFSFLLFFFFHHNHFSCLLIQCHFQAFWLLLVSGYPSSASHC